MRRIFPSLAVLAILVATMATPAFAQAQPGCKVRGESGMCLVPDKQPQIDCALTDKQGKCVVKPGIPPGPYMGPKKHKAPNVSNQQKAANLCLATTVMLKGAAPYTCAGAAVLTTK